MFKKHAITVSMSKKPSNGKDASPDDGKIIHPDTVKLIAERSKEVVKFIAITAVGAYAAIKAIDTLSEIAVKKTKSADNEED